MYKLIGMTDFVLWQKEIFNNKGYSGRYIKVTTNYANFLKKPLNIWMFVPAKLVDGVWVVLEEPKGWKNWQYVYAANNTDGKTKDRYTSQLNARWDCLEYQEAKERCLFEGFELKGKYLWNKEALFMISDNYNELFKNIKQIEWLLSNSVQSFYISETAKKQIGL